MSEAAILNASTTILACHKALDDAGVPGNHKALEGRILSLINENDRLTRMLDKEGRKDDLARLLERLDERPSDTCLLVRDAYLDAGDVRLAQAWGWLGEHKKFPFWNGHHWTWTSDEASEGGAAYSPCLPVALYDHIGFLFNREPKAPLHRTDTPGHLLAWTAEIIAGDFKLIEKKEVDYAAF